MKLEQDHQAILGSQGPVPSLAEQEGSLLGDSLWDSLSNALSCGDSCEDSQGCEDTGF